MVPSHMFGLVGQSSDPVVKSGISRKIFQERLSMVDKREMGGGEEKKEGRKEGRKEGKKGRKEKGTGEGRKDRKKEER